MLIWGLQFGVGEIIWSLKFRGSKCCLWSEICGGRDYLGSDISGMSLSKQFYSIKFVFETGQLIILGL